MKCYMMLLLMLIGPVFSVKSQNQNADILFLTNGETYSVTVKKVEPATITYSFVGEELENVIKKSSVEKIVFKSGREQLFSETQAKDSASKDMDYEYPTMKSEEGAVLPFEFVFDGSSSPEDGIEAQEYYYDKLMRKPERNTIPYQNAETTQKRLCDASIREAANMRDYDMPGTIFLLAGTGLLIGFFLTKQLDKEE